MNDYATFTRLQWSLNYAKTYSVLNENFIFFTKFGCISTSKIFHPSQGLQFKIPLYLCLPFILCFFKFFTDEILSKHYEFHRFNPAFVCFSFILRH